MRTAEFGPNLHRPRTGGFYKVLETERSAIHVGWPQSGLDHRRSLAHRHTSRITEAIDSDRHDVAWKRIHEFQEWCIERANEQRYDVNPLTDLYILRFSR